MANDFTSDGNCVLLWSLEDGALTADSIGTNTLTNSNVAADTVNFREKAGSGDFESGSSAYMHIADADLDAGVPFKNGDATKKISVCFWFRPESFPTVGNLACLLIKGSKATNFDRSLRIALGAAAGPDYYIEVRKWHNAGFANELIAQINPTNEMAANQWYHLGFTYDDSDKSWQWRVYDLTNDLAESGSGNATNPINIEVSPWQVGWDGDAGTYFDGRADEIVMFNRILTVEEIAQICQGIYGAAGLSGTIAAQSTLSGHLTILNWTPLMQPAVRPFCESLRWETKIHAGADDSEQRMAWRSFPRQSFDLPLLCRTDAEVAALDGQLHRYAKRNWAVPIWGERILHTSPIAADSGSIACDTRYADFRDGSWGMLWQANQQELIKIATVAEDSLTLGRNVQYDYGGKTLIMPVRRAVLGEAAVKDTHVGGSAIIELALDVEDNQLITGHSAAQSYDGLEVLTVPSLTDGRWNERLDSLADRLDAGFGKLGISAGGDFNAHLLPHVWLPTTKQACWELRQFFHALVGAQKSVLRPTFRHDLTLTRPIGSAETSLYVTAGGLAVNYGVNAMRQYLAFRPPGAAPIVRKVTGITAVSASEEKIDINTAPGQGFAPGAHLCWVDQCRLASDLVLFEWLGAGKLRCAVNWLRVVQ